MDSLTHIVLGGCIGEALLGKRLGKKAMLMGAMAQSIPDVDFVASFWMDTTHELIAHRGITHSFLFVICLSPLLGLLSRKTVMPRLDLLTWSAFFMLEMIVHLFLDAFNNYGVGWFEPFSNMRISFNSLYVADPFFTLFPTLAFAILLMTRSKTILRKKWWMGALVICSLYLLVCVINKLRIDNHALRSFALQNIPHEKYFTTPAPLQSFLWMVVAGDENGYYVGYRSVFDSDPTIAYKFFPANEHLLGSVTNQVEVLNLKEFSQGFYTLEQRNDMVVFNDLRFGQVIGWHNPNESFVFHYFLDHPGKNQLIVQRGRFAGWNYEVLKSFLRRIKGN